MAPREPERQPHTRPSQRGCSQQAAKWTVSAGASSTEPVLLGLILTAVYMEFVLMAILQRGEKTRIRNAERLVKASLSSTEAPSTAWCLVLVRASPPSTGPPGADLGDGGQTLSICPQLEPQGPRTLGGCPQSLKGRGSCSFSRLRVWLSTATPFPSDRQTDEAAWQSSIKSHCLSN